MTKNKFKQIFKTAQEEVIDKCYEVFTENALRFKIGTELHENFFFSQVAVETGYGLTMPRENLNYSAMALPKIFAYYKNHIEEANYDGRRNGLSANQVNIANKVYANRIGNGDIDSGDGWLYRGGGAFQLTGKANYERIAKELDMSVEDLGSNIGESDIGLLSAMAFWKLNKMYECKTIDECTAIVNKHTDSYGKRRSEFARIQSIRD